MKRERLLKSCRGQLNRDRGVQINRPNVQESEQKITTEGQIMSTGKERMILLFNWAMLEIGCHFVEEFFNVEPRINSDRSRRSSTEEKRETETDSMN
jgi:hypothetical protein